MSKVVGWKVLSPAKVNLGLRIVGRRPDGYHLLESLFWPIDLCDEISIDSANKNEVSTEWHQVASAVSELPSSENNSISKLLGLAPELGSWRIHVAKRIPIGGGLGGSSSNAGSVLREFLRRGLLSKEKAASLALKIGADVPFFLDPMPTWVTGIGETRRRLEFDSGTPSLSFLLFLFPQPCITQKVFSDYKMSDAKFSPRTEGPFGLSKSELFTYLARTGNDLEPVVRSQRGDISNLLENLRTFDLPYVSISGSGSTCFAVLTDDALGKISSKDAQQLCRKSNCSFIKVNTFGVL